LIVVKLLVCCLLSSAAVCSQWSLWYRWLVSGWMDICMYFLAGLAYQVAWAIVMMKFPSSTHIVCLPIT